MKQSRQTQCYTWPERIFLWILQMYPQVFQQAFGQQMFQTFQDHYYDVIEVENGSRVQFWLDVAGDVCKSLVREYIAVLFQHGNIDEGVIMQSLNDLTSTLRDASIQPARLEALYQEARIQHYANQFCYAITALHQETPDNLLYAAWYYRLQSTNKSESPLLVSRNWKLIIPLSLLLGFIWWGISDPTLVLTKKNIPVLVYLWTPIVVLFLSGYLAISTSQSIRRLAIVLLGLAGMTLYIIGIIQWSHTGSEYQILAALHLPLIAAGAIIFYLIGWRLVTKELFAFLIKSIEAIGAAGVYSIIGALFAGLTFVLFRAISITLPNPLLRLITIGIGGWIPLIAIASVYDPSALLSQQEFRRGFARILQILLQTLLPLAVVMLIAFIVVLPFNFFQAFTNRDTLIAFNVLLFACMGLLIGVIPLSIEEFPPTYQRWLRLGIIAIASLVLLISIYALVAISYRTLQGALTMNRLTVIGWNVINIALIVAMLWRQIKSGSKTWVEAAQSVAPLGAFMYIVWSGFLMLALPWLFR